MKTYKLRTFMTILVALLAIVFVLIAGWKLFSGDNDELARTQSTNSRPQTKTTDNNKSNNVPSSEGPDLYNTRNVARKNDAALLASHISQYSSDNNGNYPTSYSDGTLSGEGASPVSGIKLDYYKTASIMSGTQKALASDILVAVLNAECSQDGSTIDRGPGSRDFVMQYMQENADGKLTPYCMTT